MRESHLSGTRGNLPFDCASTVDISSAGEGSAVIVPVVAGCCPVKFGAEFDALKAGTSLPQAERWTESSLYSEIYKGVKLLKI